MIQSSLAIVLIAFGGLTLTGCAERKSEGDMQLATTPSKDMSHLLVTPASATGEFDINAPRDYLPDPKLDWVVTFDFSAPASGEEIKKLLDIPWQKNNGQPTFYGFSPSERRWTLVSAKDAPDTFSRLKIAWPLWDAIDERPKDVTRQKLVEFYFDSALKLANLGGSESKPELKAEDALALISALPDLIADCNHDLMLRLVAPDGQKFPGSEVCDVMLCLGLDYGDGDLFHWINNSGFGDDHFFNVETSTPPGYFIPQRMASGEGDVADLIFNYSIPRSADPIAVFDSMADAVEYAQNRLGGEIIDESGTSFDRTTERAKIEAIVQKLEDADFQPGASSTLRVF